MSKKVKRRAGVGSKMVVEVVYVNPEGVRVRETEKLFEVLQLDVVKYEEKDFDVIVMGISL